MKPTKTLHDLGQSLWLDNITRSLVNSGTLQRYIDEFSVTGLTSNPTIFDHAIKNSTDYDSDISQSASRAKPPEDLFFDLALADLTRAADLFQPIFARTDGVDGWVSLEVSPLLAHDTNRTLAAARGLHQRGGKPNLFIKIPGTAEGLPAIEAAIFAGVPINVTLLFSREQYIAAAEAYLRGVERRIEAGLNPAVASVASLFISRWDVAISGKAPGELSNRLGIAIAQRTYKAYLELLASRRFQRAANTGARAQRLLWASTGTKDPKAPDTLYVAASGIGERPGGDATSGPAASAVPLCRLAHATRPAGRRGVQDRPPARENADEADGDRGALSSSANDEARARSQDLSVSAARLGDHAAQPGVGDGHHLHSDGPAAICTSTMNDARMRALTA